MKSSDAFDVKTLAILLLTILILIAIAQNTQVVTFKFLFWKIGMSRIVLLLITILMFFLGYLLGQNMRRR